LWTVAQTVALGRGADRDSYAKLFEEATSVEPKYYNYYESKAYYLLPRWYGEVGEWEKFAEDSIKTSPLGLEVYARIVFSLSGKYKNIFSESKASWEKTKAGYDLIRQRHPESTMVIRDYLKLCQKANDRDQAKLLLKQLDNRFDSKVWSNFDMVIRTYKWAYDGTK
jgi:hypothetical protein